MKVEIAKEIEADASLVIGVKRINQILAEVVEKLSDEVTAHWELVGDLKSRNLFLNVRYDDQGAATTINLNELDDEFALRSKLRHVWMNLHQVRIDRILARLKLLESQEVRS